MESNTSSRALAPTLWAGGTNHVLRDALLVLVGTVVIAVAAKIKVPFYPVPMTLQTLAIMLIAATYGLRLGVSTLFAYLIEGALGVPVFANTPPAVAGPGYFMGTTGGFLAGFVLAAMIVGYAADRGWDRSIPKLFFSIILGEIAIFALGFAWLAWFATLGSGAHGIGAEKALVGGVEPFLLGDLLKTALVSLALPTAWRTLRKHE